MYNKLSNYATTIGNNNVTYHSTVIVSWTDYEITLNTGGWFTATTKKKMNQAARQFNLGYYVYQKNRDWFIFVGDRTIPFDNEKVTFQRT